MTSPLNRFKKPWLNLSAKVAHDISLPFMKIYGTLVSPQTLTWSPHDWRGLHFANRLGPAGGTDKNAELVKAFWAFGAGFVEIGTVTPEPQDPNPGEIMGRDTDTLAVWNKMGFPNLGAETVHRNLKKLKRPYATPLFINIGKNRTTPNEKAQDDYLKLIRKFADVADVFVVNISSPNTSGLRELLKPQNLLEFLKPLVAASHGDSKFNIPLLLKLSPDITDAELRQTLDVSLEAGVDGWILSNTTLAREPGSKWPTEGGVSGRPLTERAKELLKNAVGHLGSRRKDRLIISAGGVLTPQDVTERLRLGAELVQTYSALIFDGPTFFRKVSDQYE